MLQCNKTVAGRFLIIMFAKPEDLTVASPEVRMLKTLCLTIVLIFACAMSACARENGVVAQEPIGVGFGVQVQQWHTSDEDLAKISQTGFGLVRWGIAWDGVEKAPGVYDWSKSDIFFKRLHAAGLRSVVMLGQGNPLYTGMVDTQADQINSATRRALPPSNPRQVALFARFAAAAAQRYADQNPIWEIWNEPDLGVFWPPKPQPEPYAALITATCTSIKQVDPKATVIGPAGAAMPDAASPYFDSVMAAVVKSPAVDCLDAISAHAYRMKKGEPQPAPETVQVNNIRSIQWLSDRTGNKHLKYVCSEWGYAPPLVTPEQQAAYPLRAHLSNLLSDVPMTIWYEWKDSHHDTANPESHYGLLDFDGNEKPGFKALSAVLPKIKTAIVIRRLEVNSDSAYVVLVRQPAGDYGLVYWSAADALQGPLSLAVANKTVASLTATPAYLAVGTTIPNVILR